MTKMRISITPWMAKTLESHVGGLFVLRAVDTPIVGALPDCVMEIEAVDLNRAVQLGLAMPDDGEVVDPLVGRGLL